MKSKNINGFYSGGYSFDVLDRFAQKELLKATNFKYQFTSCGFIRYYAKLFKKTENCKLDYIKQADENKFIVKTSLFLENTDNKPVASAWFMFVGKNHIRRRKKKNERKF